jgi:hypothetical protein
MECQTSTSFSAPFRHIGERRLRFVVSLCLGENHGIQGTDGHAGNLPEIAVAMNDNVVDRAGLEGSFETAATEHQSALLFRIAIVEALCRG